MAFELASSSLVIELGVIMLLLLGWQSTLAELIGAPIIIDSGRLLAPADFRGRVTSVAHVFVMEWAAVWKDRVARLLIAGAIGAWVPDAFWQRLRVGTARGTSRELHRNHRGNHGVRSRRS